MIRINPANIGMEGECLSGEEDPSFLDLASFPQDIQAKGPVKYALHASLAGRDLLVTGRAEVSLLSPCAVCLEETEYRLANEEICIHVENVPMDGFYDLTGDIRENLLLNMPMRIKCRENCKGLCPSCGANLNEGECSCGKKKVRGKKKDSPGKGENTDWSALDQLKF